MDIRGEIRQIVTEILELEDGELIDGKKFTEYDFDSLLGLDILSALEKKFKVRIPEADFSKMVHVDSTVTLINEHLGKK